MFNPDTVIDISMELNEKTVVWVQDPQPQLRPIARLPKDGCNFTWLDFGAHAGTHVDAPYYLFSDKWTADQIPLSRLIGPCQVMDLTAVDDMISLEDIKKIPLTQKKVLLKTKNSYDAMEKYNPNHVALSVEAAKYLLKKGVTTVGFDYQSFERDGANVLHTLFLKESVTLLDNLRLANAEGKDYQLICLPVKLTGIDGAPARAILVENNL